MRTISFRNVFTTTMVTGGLLLFSFSANAQGWHRDFRDSGSVVNRAQQDLDYAGSRVYDRHDAKRIEHARHQLSDFERKFSRGRFDKGELDEAIGTMQSVVDHNAMPNGARVRLQEDTNRLRDFRASRGYGHGYEDGYRR